ncbi:hypothetical protein VTP01DRAFT_27 [Rhizomucor pusillus]|uniref:uncharacterized protein n=1 Tax=Rhizomucor pusillus TaxID=4840 RepID=UPI003742A4C2
MAASHPRVLLSSTVRGHHSKLEKDAFKYKLILCFDTDSSDMYLKSNKSMCSLNLLDYPCKRFGIKM